MDRKTTEIVMLFLKKLGKDFLIDKIILFGSRARSDYLKHSDFDLIIVSKDFEGIDFTKRITKMYDYWAFDYDVDFFCYTPKEFERLSKMIGIISEALKRGIEIKI